MLEFEFVNLNICKCIFVGVQILVGHITSAAHKNDTISDEIKNNLKTTFLIYS